MSEGKREKEDDDGNDGVIALIRLAVEDQGTLPSTTEGDIQGGIRDPTRVSSTVFGNIAMGTGRQWW
jgi:hypothetical protein